MTFLKVIDTETLDLVNKKVYNEYTNIDKLIYQINQVSTNL